ncbi:asparagine synthase [Salinisphaera dokdonensis CL-ES53]|uniref:asparagine synthase (glutamine-hydrolyzing) n=1 Tax=Salinisphaera dokdonensis CL-ES53 TaxID=1304272 RepID=A0ABV2B482_9GAMM
MRVKKLAVRLAGGAVKDVEKMLCRQNLTSMPAATRVVDDGFIGCLGAASLPDTGNLLLFSGVPINAPDDRQFTDASAAQRLFPQCDGAFAGIFWDAQNRVLVVATDCLGMQPLYMRHDETGLTLVSETKALEGEPDLAAWGAFISMGHPIGDRSLMHGVTRVPAASLLTYDCRRRELRIECHWHWPEPSDAWREYDFVGALESEVRAYGKVGPPGTLLLSGGFDSRLLLFLLKRAGVPVTALAVAHEDEHGDIDGRLAERVARQAGVALRKVRPAANFFSSAAYLDYLAASDVGFPSLDLFIAKVGAQAEPGAVWDGLAPGFWFMPLHQPEGGFHAYRQQEIQGPDSANWRAAAQLFKSEVVRAMRRGFEEDLESQFDRLTRDGYGLARFVIENRSRNRPAMNPLKVYANHALSYTPGLSREFIDHAALIPIEAKRNAAFYYDLFSRLDRRGLRLPFLSGGLLLKAPGFNPAFHGQRARIAWTRARERYPSLFGAVAGALQYRSPPHSRFLSEALVAKDDAWLDSGCLGALQSESKRASRPWKLLFHWKAWRALHGDGLSRVFDR